MTTRFLSTSGPTSSGLKRLGALLVLHSCMGNSPQMITRANNIKSGLHFPYGATPRETSDAYKPLLTSRHNVRFGCALRETGNAKLHLAWCRNCELELRWFARSAVSDVVAPMRTPHVWIAAMSGFTPRMFMTRVRL